MNRINKGKGKRKKMENHSKDSNNSFDAKADASLSMPTFGLAVSKKPKSHKNWLVAVLVSAFLVSASVAAFYLIAKLPTSNDSKVASGLSAATHFASPQALVDTIKPDIQGSLMATTISNGLGGDTADGYASYSLPAYQVAGKKFANLPAQGTGSGYSGNSAVAAAGYKKLVDFFTANRFNLVKSSQGGTGPISINDDVVFVSYAVYESSNLVCSIWHADASGSPIKNHVVSIGCADKTSYAVAANALAPYYAAYVKAVKNSTKGLVFGDPSTSDGADSYKNASVYQEDASLAAASNNSKAYFQGLYYMAPGSKDWTFFSVAQKDLSCTAFNTDVLKKAFSNLTCYDDASKKTVTVQS